MPFGKRLIAPSVDAEAETDMCPKCRGVGAIRGRGQRKVCLACKGTGKKPEPPPEPEPQPESQPELELQPEPQLELQLEPPAS